MRLINCIDKRHSDLSKRQLELSQDGLAESLSRDTSAVRNDKNNAWF
jgi:hypothetical protein